MKKIMALVFILAVVGGSAAGAYLYFKKPAEAAGNEEVQEVVSHDSEETSVEFIELDPLILPILDKNGVTQTISIVVSLEVKDAAAVEKVNKMIPRLKDAYIQELYGFLNHSVSSGGAIRVDILKKRLNKISKKVMGEGIIQDVLLQVVQQRGL